MAKKAASKSKSKPVSGESETPKAAPKAHARKPKKSELELLEKGRVLAADYLVTRDGMDLQTATDVVEGMSADEVNDLIHEANTTTLAKTAATMSHPPAETAAKIAESVLGEVLGDEPDPAKVFTEYYEIEALVSNEEFPDMVQKCIDSAATKNKAEKEYKDTKKKLVAIFDAAGVKLVSVLGIKAERYKGQSPKQLDPILLMEKGVDPLIINQCYKSTDYDDIRFIQPKAAK